MFFSQSVGEEPCSHSERGFGYSTRISQACLSGEEREYFRRRRIPLPLQHPHPRVFYFSHSRSVKTPARVASEGSVTPLEDRLARLSGEECEYFRHRRISLPPLTLLASVLFLWRSRSVKNHARTASEGSVTPLGDRQAWNGGTKAPPYKISEGEIGRAHV